MVKCASFRRPLEQGAESEYMALVRALPLARIRNKEQHTSALKVTGRLIGMNRKLTNGEEKYLDALVVLIRDYEQNAQDRVLFNSSGVSVLRHLMDEQAMTRKELGDLIGVGPSAVSMILSGKRELTRSHITTLSAHFHVGVGAFFG